MPDMKDLLIRKIEDRAYRRIGQLAGKLVRARSQAKEVVLAELQYERWVAESCRECL